jgi:hypothetical protein
MKVFPKNDDIRRVLAHPTAGKFRAEGLVDWPDDSFTQRRIRDGDITPEGGGDPQMTKHEGGDPQKQEKTKFSRKSE